MIRLIGSATGQTDYGVRGYLGTTLQGSRLTLAETLPRQYEVLPTGWPAGTYTIIIDKNETEVGRAIYEWDGLQEVTNTALNATLEAVLSLAQTTTPSTYRATSSSIQIQC
jgi:hypothetical protein